VHSGATSNCKNINPYPGDGATVSLTTWHRSISANIRTTASDSATLPLHKLPLFPRPDGRLWDGQGRHAGERTADRASPEPACDRHATTSQSSLLQSMTPRRL